MKFTTKPTSAPPRGVDAFTLAEVLAALVFMAIVIPVALQGLQIASRAGTVAERKREAARVAERVLNESIVTTNYFQAVTSGTVQEAEREYRWHAAQRSVDRICDAVVVRGSDVSGARSGLRRAPEHAGEFAVMPAINLE